MSVSSTPQAPVIVVTQENTPTPQLKDTSTVVLHEWASRMDVHMEKVHTAPPLITCVPTETQRKLQEILREYYHQPGFQLDLKDPGHTKMVVTAVLGQRVSVGSDLEAKMMKEAKSFCTGTKMSERVIETYRGHWHSLRMVYDLDHTENDLRQKVLDLFIQGVQNPKMAENLQTAVREAQKELPDDTVLPLGKAIDILNDQKK
ncbi:hypothetical protein ADUPG1_001676, partial [Aduncisulcus paluster]